MKQTTTMSRLKTVLAVISIYVLLPVIVGAESLFPSSDSLFGVSMPDMRFVIGRDPDAVENAEGGKLHTYHDFTAEDYDLFSRYAAAENVTLREYSVDDEVLTVKLQKSDMAITLRYNYSAREASVLYPNGTRPEGSAAEADLPPAGILPDVEQVFGLILPSVSKAIKREPDAVETLKDGSRQEVYQNFTAEDYAAFNAYLLDWNCAVSDYYVNGNGALVIALKTMGSSFEFTYDQVWQRALVVYPAETQVEPVFEPTPVPTATPKPTKTPKPTATPKSAATPKPTSSTYRANFSESQCYSVAADYLKSVLKNPSSLQIHSYRTITYDDTYCFVFDYSAQNGFGGYTRSEAFIWITKATGQVYWSDFK